MSDNIIQLNEQQIHSELKDLVKKSVEETLNTYLNEEAEKLVNAERYARIEGRQGYRSGHYERKLTTSAGEVSIKVPKLKGLTFKTAIIERYRRRESSIEEALVEMYLAGCSVRRVEDISKELWGTKISPGTISNLNKKIYENIETWRNRPLEGEYPYVYVDGIYLKQSWGGEFENVSILIAVGVNQDGKREILGAKEGLKEDGESWKEFFIWLKGRGLSGVKMIVGDKSLGMIEQLALVFGNVKYQRCTVHFYRNVFSNIPKSKRGTVAAMLKAIHNQEDKAEAKKKAEAVITKLREMRLNKAADIVEKGIDETLTYMNFPREHWVRIRTNNVLERLNREIKRRTKVVGTFPDGNSALMLVCARLRYVLNSEWSTKRYLNMDPLLEMEYKENGDNCEIG